MSAYRTIDDLDVAGKRVVLRADFNVPMKKGKVTDRTRIERAAATIAELVRRGAKVVVVSHFGRPEGKTVPEMSLRPIAPVLSEALGGLPVAFADDCVGELARKAVAKLGNGEVLLLENLRFHAGEEKNDPGFAGELAALGDLYVDDAFSCAHRAHASTEAIARLLPSAPGRLMEAELDHLERALAHPQRPLAAIVGGAKVSTKLALLGNLLAKVDLLAIGGGMANTFLHAQGKSIGKSLAERDMAGTARDILDKAWAGKVDIVLPLDAVVAAELKPGVEARTVAIDAVPADRMILDVGPATVADLERRLAGCRTLVWNGPLGAFETPPFEAGTVAVARKAAELTTAGRLLSVAGGGDTVAALIQAGVADRFSYVSTAGGAFLEWLEGKTLPGVAALARK
ncbi:MAG TPA: phosphoglycerate kinase [Candidatus Udaeobacter sp.]|nr:phosphoglycerate kinase [Candidatus Udaeobacter sp.]